MSALRVSALCAFATGALSALVGTQENSAIDTVWLVWSFACFGAGTLAMLVVLVRAAGRSRNENVDLGAVFLLYGSRSKRTVALVHAATVAQCVGPSVAIAMRPYSIAAFGFLIPVVGVAAGGWWGLGHLRFPPRSNSVTVPAEANPALGSQPK